MLPHTPLSGPHRVSTETPLACHLGELGRHPGRPLLARAQAADAPEGEVLRQQGLQARGSGIENG